MKVVNMMVKGIMNTTNSQGARGVKRSSKQRFPSLRKCRAAFINPEAGITQSRMLGWENAVHKLRFGVFSCKIAAIF
jgi:hypothetical protein